MFVNFLFWLVSFWYFIYVVNSNWFKEIILLLIDMSEKEIVEWVFSFKV